MGKILYTEKTAKGDINYVSGVVTAIKESSDNKHPHVISMVATLRDKVNKVNIQRTIQLRSWPDSKWNRIEIVHKMKVEPGSFITAVVGNMVPYKGKNSKEEVLQTPLFSCNYSSDLAARTDPNIHIVTGYVKSINEESNGSGVITISVGTYNHDTQERGKKDYTCLVPAKKFAALKSANLKKGGNIAVCGSMVSETTVSVKSAEFAEKAERSAD